MRTLAVLLLAAAACGGKSDDPKPQPKDAGIAVHAPVTLPFHTETMPIPLAEPLIELPKQESFTLVAPGKAPLAVLRYKLEARVGSYLAETALTTRHVEPATGAWSAPLKLAVIHDGFSISTQPTNLQMRPLPATLDGPSSPDTEEYIGGWKTEIADHRANAAIDARGQLGKVVFNDDPSGEHTQNPRDELAQRLLATLVPLPDKPVGIGAVWKVVTILRQRHAYLKQTATYTLTAITTTPTTAWTIGVDIKRTAEAQRVLDPTLPQGASIDLVAMFRELSGTLTIDPTHPIGVGKLAVESRLHVRVNVKDSSTEQLVEDLGTVVLTAPTP